MDDITHQLVLVGALSIASQLLAYRIKIPAILPLLVTGIIVGPILGLLNADAIFGDLLFPIVSLSVAIILFEGALTLRFKDLSGHGSMVRNLCTVGALTTWLTVSFAAQALAGISWSIALLFGAIVTVTGPTVIAPMLRSVRPSKGVANILRWEGIVIDPIGALLAVLVFEYLIASQDPMTHTLSAFAMALVSGFSIGSAAGYALGLAIRNHWLPHYLVNIAVLTLILTAFAASNALAHESGLLTVTVAGIILANMRGVEIDGILEFKENLSVLLISALFILLASRIDLSSITALGLGVVALMGVILFVSRPLAVLISSIGTGLRWQEIALLSWLAPRGIVAAAVSALFALKLEASGYEEAAVLVPLVFLVIVVTVVIQSLTSAPIATLLGERSPPPDGVLIFGANKFSRLLAKELMKNDIAVKLADTNWSSISDARMEDIPTYFGSPISADASLNLDISQYGTLLVMSPYRQLNPMVTYHFQNYLGKNAVYTLKESDPDQRSRNKVSDDYATGIELFSESASYAKVASLVAQGASIKATRLSDSFSDEDYEATYGSDVLRLFAITKEGALKLYTPQKSFNAKADWLIVSLINNQKSATLAEPTSS